MSNFRKDGAVSTSYTSGRRGTRHLWIWIMGAAMVVIVHQDVTPLAWWQMPLVFFGGALVGRQLYKLFDWSVVLITVVSATYLVASTFGWLA